MNTYFGSQPVAWIDDDHREKELAWSEARNADGAATLLIKPESEEGLQRNHIEEVKIWLGHLSVDTA